MHSTKYSQFMTVWIGILALLLLGNLTYASGTQTFSKERIGGDARNVGEIITYKLKLSCNSLTGDCGGLTLTDVIPDGTEIDSCSVPPGFTVNQCIGTNINITKDNLFDGGDTFEITVKLRIQLDADPNTPITNTATSVITDPDNGTPASIDSSADPITVSPPTPKYTPKKMRTSPTPPMKPAVDNPVTYQVALCADQAIGNVNMNDVILTDTFQDGAVVVDDNGSTVSGHTLTWDLGDIDLATLYGNDPYGSEKCIVREYTLIYPGSDFNATDPISNTLSATGTPEGGSNGPIGQDVVLDESIGVPVSDPTPGKDADDVKPHEDLIWKLEANLDQANAPTKDLVVYDTLPSTPTELKAESLTSGQWSSPSTVYGASNIEAEIFYAIDHAGDCTNATYISLTNGFIPSPASATDYSLDENTTCVKWVFRDNSGLTTAPDIPIGWRFTTQPLLTQDTTAYDAPIPIEVENCMQITHTDDHGDTQNKESCAKANIEEATPEIILEKSAMPYNNLKPGDLVEYTLHFKHDTSDSTGDSRDPVVADLLPAGLEFVSWDSVSGLAGNPEPNMEVVEDFGGADSNQTLIRFSWADPAPAGSVKLDGSAGAANAADLNESVDVYIKFTARVSDGAVAATYTNKVEYFDHAPNISTCDGVPQTDTEDLDGDGNTTESVCFAQKGVAVIAAAVLGGEKWIKGDENLIPEFVNTTDTSKNDECPVFTNGGENYTRYPCVAQTTKGDDFKHLLRVRNTGNVDLDHYVLYDMLPRIGDTGSGEPLSTMQRGTEWNPVLTGAITAVSIPGGINPVIEYSTALNPCRPEVSSTADESGWQPGCTDDWSAALPADPTTVTAFRVKVAFDGGQPWHPLEEMLFSVPMQAPKIGPGSEVTDVNDLHPAWNSFAHRVSYGGGANRLATSEPRQVGIILPLGPEVSIGSVVWGDDDDSGTQDANESGIEGATVKLFLEDPDHPGIFIPAIDRRGRPIQQQTTDASGTYFFDELPEGNYTVEVTPPLYFTPSTTQNTNSNDDTPGDSNIAGPGTTAGSYTSGIFELTEDGEPTGAAEVSSLPNNADDRDDDGGSATQDDNNGNMTVDFGFIPPVSIGSTVFYDYDDDGIQDPGEKGISGVVVKLYAANGTTQINNPATGQPYVVTTDANGNYFFENLPKGSYVVGVTPPANAQTSSQDIPSSSADNQIDGDDNGDQTNPGDEAKSPIITLLPGTEPLNGTESDTGPDTAGDNQDDSDDNAGDMTVDFGFVPDPVPVSIGSTVFYDNNNNGIQDPGETGISDVRVNLYADVDGDELPDTSDVNKTMVTDANGNYYFDNLLSGNYIVGVVPSLDAPKSSTDIGSSSADNEIDGDDNGQQAHAGDEARSPIINLINGTEPTNGTEHDTGPDTTGDNQDDINDTSGDMTVDFGFIPSVSIGSVIWEDKDRDGLQDVGELRIQGAQVGLFVNNGSGSFVPALDIYGIQVGTVTTDSNGTYYFGNLPAGEYKVNVVPPEGYLPTEHQTTTDDNGAVENDSNIAANPTPNNYESAPITLTPGGEKVETSTNDGDGADGADNSSADKSGDMTVDFGFVKPVSIGSVIWEDKNRDGIQDTAASEPRIAGAVVHLLMEDPAGSGTFVAAKHVDGSAVDDNTTGADGTYFFDKLPEGNYKVQVTPPAQYAPTPVQTTADNNDTEKDSNIASSPSAGVYESGEFNLTAGGEPQEATADDGDDNDGTGGSISDLAGNMTVDFGFVQPMSIGSVLWEDINADGIQGDAASEPRIADANVTLLMEDPNNAGSFISATDINGAAVPIQTTGADGTYYFGNLPEGNYTVAVQVAPTYEPTPQQTTADNNDTVNDSNIADENATHYLSGMFTLSTGNEPTEAGLHEGDNQDNGASETNGNMTVDFGFVQPVSIGSVVWEDVNKDGQQGDAVNEPRIEDANVTLLVDNGSGTFIPAIDLNGANVPMVQTDVNGTYYFGNLPAGTYKVQITPPAQYISSPVQTLTDDDDAEGDSNIADRNLTTAVYTSGAFTLVAGNEPQESDTFEGDNQDGNQTATDSSGNMTVDFGFVQSVSIGSVIWEDVDKDGQQDATEPKITGAVAHLLVDDGSGIFVDATDMYGDPITDVNTTSDGKYYFGNLAEGTYKVQITPPAQYIPTPVQTTADNNDTEGDSNFADANVTTGIYTSGEFNLTIGGEPTEDGTKSGDDQDDVTGESNGNMTVDFGFVQPVSIGSYVWEDSNGDGLQDATEPKITGATLHLLVDDGSGTFIDATDIYGGAVSDITTTADGKYYFGNLPEGTYKVQVTPPAGYTMTPNETTGNNDDTVNDSNIASSPSAGLFESAEFNLTVGGEPSETGNHEGDDQDNTAETNGNMTVDFGFVPDGPVSIGSTVFYDFNNNGIQDAGEEGIPETTVNLYEDANGDGVPEGIAIATMQTDENGDYYFGDLATGNYIVGVEAPVTAPDSSSTGVTDTADNDEDGDDNGIQTASGNEALSPSITLVSGSEADNTVETYQGAGQDDANETAGNMTVDFGFVPPTDRKVSIGSTVFYDFDDDGIQDAGERGIPGSTVNLYADADGDGVPDGTAIASMQTDANGDYFFGGLNPGNYIVGVAAPTSAPDSSSAGVTDMEDNSEDGDDNGIQSASGSEALSPSITLIFGTEANNTIETFQGGIQDDANDTAGDMTVDFGFVPPADQNVSIGSTVFYDFNDNGIQDLGEIGIPGAVVKLYAADGVTELNNTVTDANGDYYFGDLTPGSYVVGVAAPTTAPISSTDIATTNGDNQTDGDDNGIQAASGEEARSPVITLVAGTEPLDVNEPFQGGDQDTEDANGDMTIDFGFVPPVDQKVSIGSTVFYDFDNNGTQDLGDTGIPGVTVKLYAADGVTELNSTVTDANGDYYFGDLAPGSYIVGVEAPVQAPTSSLDIATTGGDNQTDGDDNGIQAASGQEARSSVITLVAGSEANNTVETAQGNGQDDADDTAGDMTVDFGFVPPTDQLVSIGSTVFYDYNDNGIQEPGDGEEGIVGVTVKLYAADGVTELNSTVTDENGTYYFGDLPPGGYIVGVEAPTTAPTSSTDITTTSGDNQTDGDDNGIQSAPGEEARSPVITLVAGTEPDNTLETAQDAAQDDVNETNGDMTIDFGFIGLGSLSGNVSHEDGDGVLHPMQGVTLVLYDANGNEVARTTTDEHGNYLFEDLRPGNYTVVELQPDGYFDVRENAGGADDDNSTLTPPNAISATVDGGENDIENDFVEAQESSLGDYVWYDNDNDGVQDAEEAGVEGVMVILTDEDGNKYTATTDDQGAYRFDHLDPTKGYSVEFNLTTLPEGYAPTRADQEGDDTLDSDADEQGRVDAVTLRPGEHDPTIDMGIRPEGAIGDRQYLVGTHFWIDNDDDGIYDPDVDTPIGGATVTLYHADGTPVLDEDDNPLVTTTGPDGDYHFYVEEGDYYAQFTLPQSYRDDGYDFVVEQSDNTDNAVNKNTAGRDGITQTVHVGPDGRSADLTLDAAVNCACSGIPSDGADALSMASLLAMMFLILSAGIFFVRREEQQA